MTGTSEKVTLTVDGVNACDRELLNRACAANRACGISEESRGDVVSRLIREYAVQTYGAEFVKHMIQQFEEQRLRKQSYNEAAQNTSTGSSFDPEP